MTRFSGPRASVFLFVGLLLMASVASADTISSASHSFSLTGTSPAGQTVQFEQFDASLGTLTSVAVHIISSTAHVEGTATVRPFGTGSCASDTVMLRPIAGGHFLAAISASTTFSANPCPSTIFLQKNGNPTGSFVAPGALSDYIGLGTAGIVFDYNTSFASAGSWSGDAELVYTYTPTTAPVPEPSSLMLLASGGLGAVGVLRRKLRL